MAVRRGFTLLEVLLSGVLMLLLLALLFGALLPILKGSRRGSEKSDLRQTVAISLQQICDAVESTAATGLRWDQEALTVHPVRDLRSDGQTMWSQEAEVFFMRKTPRLLLHRVIPKAGTGRPWRWKPGELASFLSAPSTSERLLCSDAESFSVEGLTQHGLRLPLLLKLTVKRENQSFSLEAVTQPRVRLNQ